QDQITEGNDQPTIFREGDKFDRIKQTEARMLPADERFHAHELKTTNVYLRLVVNDEFGFIQTRSQITLEHELFESARRSTRGVKLIVVAALHLGAVECDACGLQQARGIASVVRIK